MPIPLVEEVEVFAVEKLVMAVMPAARMAQLTVEMVMVYRDILWGILKNLFEPTLLQTFS